MKNKLIDLNNHLFEQLERLNDEGLSAEDIKRECQRTEAMVSVSEQIIANASLAVQASKLVAEYGGRFETMLPMLENTDEVMKDRRPDLNGKKRLA
ncbi:MAG: hypothetical protein AB7T38_02540 [Nitrospirales bacterium]